MAYVTLKLSATAPGVSRDSSKRSSCLGEGGWGGLGGSNHLLRIWLEPHRDILSVRERQQKGSPTGPTKEVDQVGHSPNALQTGYDILQS